MTRAVVLAALLIACGQAPPAEDLGAPPDAGDDMVAVVHRRDLAQPSAADLAQGDLAQPAGDLAREDLAPPPPDLEPPRDLAQPPLCSGQGLGGTQQPCCPGLTCWQGDGVLRTCLVNREAAGGPDYRCIDRRPGCAGTYAGSCCAVDGSPVFNVYGYCDPVYQPGSVQSTYCHSWGCG